MATYILGISALFHDSAACLLLDGEIVAAAQEERFTRIKHDASFPVQAILACLKQASITIDDVDYVGFYEKPHLKFERILSTAGSFFPRGFGVFAEALSSWIRFKFWLPSVIPAELEALSPSSGNKMRWDGKVIYCEHHFSHAASSFFASPFQESAILTVDGVGEWSTVTTAIGRTDEAGVPQIKFLQEMQYPHSLGMLYSAFTSYLGFKVNSGEYKVMGLAPYGQPRYADKIFDKVITVKNDGSFELNMDYFCFPYSHEMTNEHFAGLFGGPPRGADDLLEAHHYDMAASVQHVVEEVVLKMANHLQKSTGLKRLCLAGGVALNCVANGRLLRESSFDDVWAQPASGDAGGALGVALYIHHEVLKRPARRGLGVDLMKGGMLGSSFTVDEVEAAIRKMGVPFHQSDMNTITAQTATLLADGNVVGWFQGRMEFGPRSLGARSILADPRSKDMQRKLNLKIKFRESFRPFAPVVLREHVQDWFELKGKEASILGGKKTGYDSPYMLLVAPVKTSRCRQMSEDEVKLEGIDKLNIVRSEIPSCTHVDYSARIQTVAADTNPRLYALIADFYSKTGVPVLVNTSFNIRSEPIVCSPEDAIRCFLGTDMDVLVLENCILFKKEIPSQLLIDYRHSFELD
jgi:carbamoyltransferase